VRGLLSVTACLAGAAPAAAQLVRESPARIDSLRLLARRDSCDPGVFYSLGMALLSRQQYDAADSALRHAVRIDPRLAEGWYALGAVQNDNRRYWDTLRRQGPDAESAERQQRSSWRRKAFLIDPFVDVSLLPGAAATAAWDVLDAMVSRAAAPRGTLDSVPAGLLWAHALASARTLRYRDAIGDLETLLRLGQAAERDPTMAGVPLRTNEFRYMLAALQQRAGNSQEAVRLYADVLANDLGNYMAHVQLAGLYEAARDWPAALRERRAATDVNPDDHTLFTDLAVTLTRADQWPAAEDALQQALTMGTCDTRILYLLGVVQQHNGRLAEARRSFETFLALAPRGALTPREDAQRRLARLP